MNNAEKGWRPIYRFRNGIKVEVWRVVLSNEKDVFSASFSLRLETKM
jgi:hypothetical protein